MLKRSPASTIPTTATSDTTVMTSEHSISPSLKQQDNNVVVVVVDQEEEAAAAPAPASSSRVAQGPNDMNVMPAREQRAESPNEHDEARNPASVMTPPHAGQQERPAGDDETSKMTASKKNKKERSVSHKAVFSDELINQLREAITNNPEKSKDMLVAPTAYA